MELRQLAFDFARSCAERGVACEDAVRTVKREYITHLLTVNKGNQCKTAREMGWHRNTLSRVLDDLDINPREIRRVAKKPVGSVCLIQENRRMNGTR